MSYYINDDHADWVQRQINFWHQNGTKSKLRRNKYGEAIGWMAAPEKLNTFQSRVWNILGTARGGIYNASISWDTVIWDERFLCVKLACSYLATTDSNELTQLVFLCHEARIRLAISPVNYHYLMLEFHQRDASGDNSHGHKNLDEAVAAFREWFPDDHQIVYRPEPKTEQVAA